MLRTVAVVLALSAFPALAAAGAGDLDPSFGTAGSVALTAPGIPAAGRSVIVLPDGRLLVAGTTTGSSSDFVVARLLADGSLDPTFGSAGMVTTDVNGQDDSLDGMLRQPDGAIVVIGRALFGVTSRVALVRYDADGALDGSFGVGGITSITFPSSGEQPTTLGRQSDGSLIAVGPRFNGANYDFALARFDASGTLDATFGTAGVATTDFGAEDDYPYAVIVEPGDTIVVAGTAGLGGGNHGDFALARYTTDGAPDPTFDGDGRVTTDASPDNSTSDEAHALLRQPDGKYVIAGFAAPTGGLAVMGLARYDATGTLDAGFGLGGFASVSLFPASAAFAYGLVRAPDGALVAAGFRYAPPAQSFLLARWTAAGILDTGFGRGGVVTAPDGGAFGLAQQPDTNLVAVGLVPNGSASKIGVARYFGGVCGNGTPEPGEVCEDGNVTSGDGCDANCTPTGCGNGIMTGAEACDDGNVADGDCCSSTCELDGPSAPCADDGNLCSNDTCDGHGGCTHTVAPAPDCFEPLFAGKAKIALGTQPRPKVAWQWKKGPAIPGSFFGDPVVDTGYALCIYDHVAGVPHLALGRDVPGGSLCDGEPCWRATARGFAYKDAAATNGITKIQLSAGTLPGKAKVAVAGKGTALGPLSLPFAQSPTVVVQLRNSVGKCWGTTHATHKKNDATRFDAKSD